MGEERAPEAEAHIGRVELDRAVHRGERALDVPLPLEETCRRRPGLRVARVEPERLVEVVRGGLRAAEVEVHGAPLPPGRLEARVEVDRGVEGVERLERLPGAMRAERRFELGRRREGRRGLGRRSRRLRGAGSRVERRRGSGRLPRLRVLTFDDDGPAVDGLGVVRGGARAVLAQDRDHLALRVGIDPARGDEDEEEDGGTSHRAPPLGLLPGFAQGLDARQASGPRPRNRGFP